MNTTENATEIVQTLETWLAKGLADAWNEREDTYFDLSIPDEKTLYENKHNVINSGKPITEGILAMARVFDGKYVEHAYLSDDTHIPGLSVDRPPRHVIVAWNQAVGESINNDRYFAPDGEFKLQGVFVQCNYNGGSFSEFRVGLILAFEPDPVRINLSYREFFTLSESGYTITAFTTDDGLIVEHAYRVVRRDLPPITAKEIFRQKIGISRNVIADDWCTQFTQGADGYYEHHGRYRPNPRMNHIPQLGQYLTDLAAVLGKK
ncbi:MAG: hypothetical protein JWM07_864 [Candidatus Saccharibacteria bacterium]|nr:hypothetical protein [Candidatus Saccharibacteria bacterium]